MKIFKSPADRDGTIIMIALFVALFFVLMRFGSTLTASEINFVLGALMTQIGNVVLHFFKKESNGKEISDTSGDSADSADSIDDSRT